MINEKEYKDIVRLVLEKDKEDALFIYTKLFVKRLKTSEENNIEFINFFKDQLSEYFSQKGNMILSLPEGDMISDLILTIYQNREKELSSSIFCNTISGRENLLREVKIVFPVDEEKEQKIKEEEKFVSF